MGTAITSILDKDGKLDENKILQGIKKYKFGLRDSRQGSQTNGFTLLLFSVIQNNIKIAKACLQEIQYKTTQNCVIDGIAIPENSSAVQVAIYFRNYELVKIMLEYVQKENPAFKKILAQHNANNESLLHTLILSKDKKMQQILIDTGYFPYRLELNGEQSTVDPPILLSIKENQPIMVNYIFQLCNICAFRESSQVIIKQNAENICSHLNKMLEDKNVDKNDLQLCRKYVVDFMYNILPKARQNSNSDSNDKVQIKTKQYIEEHKSVTEEIEQNVDEFIIRSATQYNKYHTIKNEQDNDQDNQIAIEPSSSTDVKPMIAHSSQSSFGSLKMLIAGKIVTDPTDHKYEQSVMSTVPTHHSELHCLGDDSFSLTLK